MATSHQTLHFPTQRDNEHVVLLLRRHWTVIARDVAQLLISLLLPPAVLLPVLLYTNIRILPDSVTYIVLVELFSLYYLFSFLAFFHDFVDYHLDIWVVTDQRIVSIEQQGLFNRVVSELNIEQVQDVTSEVRGYIQTLLDFGQVHVQTAAETARFVFEQIPHPAEVSQIVLRVHDRAIKQQNRDLMHDQVEYEREITQTTPPTA